MPLLLLPGLTTPAVLLGVRALSTSPPSSMAAFRELGRTVT